ncbi:hypothetical protein [Frankia sp. AgPm24]|uniref:hypothetical protein n=1 Tax=Frankia sp. AgPm24 TaxID=631128 RepID=UPI00200BAFFB|nr:hypothetical protein [Frankia sp. AgPm24]
MNTTVPPGDYKWILGFSMVNLVVGTVGSAVVRRRCGDTAGDTFQRRTGTAIAGVFTVWAAVFWGFIWAAFGAGLFLVSHLVERYRRQRTHTGKP